LIAIPRNSVDEKFGSAVIERLQNVQSPFQTNKPTAYSDERERARQVFSSFSRGDSGIKKILGNDIA